MRIDKTRAYLISADIYYFVSFIIDVSGYFYDAVVFYKNVSGVRPSACTIIYHSAFEQCPHYAPPYSLTESINLLSSS